MLAQPVKASWNATNQPGGILDAGPPPFEQVYSENFPFVWRCLRALGLPDRAVDDAAQDVFLAVHRQLHAFRGESTVRTWLFSILRHVASNHRRTVHRKETHDRPLRADLAQASPDPLEQAQNAQAASFIRDFLMGR